MVNQDAKVAPGVVEAATNDINAIATDRISQVISLGGKEMERVLSKILRGAIEDVYQTPFRLLEILGNNNSIKLKEKYQINLLQIINLFKYKLYTKNYFYYIPPPPPPPPARLLFTNNYTPISFF